MIKRRLGAAVKHGINNGSIDGSEKAKLGKLKRLRAKKMAEAKGDGEISDQERGAFRKNNLAARKLIHSFKNN